MLYSATRRLISKVVSNPFLTYLNFLKITMTIPQTITIKSDNNKLQYKETIKGKEPIFVYVYCDSIEKLGMELRLNEHELKKLINSNQ